MIERVPHYSIWNICAAPNAKNQKDQCQHIYSQTAHLYRILINNTEKPQVLVFVPVPLMYIFEDPELNHRNKSICHQHCLEILRAFDAYKARNIIPPEGRCCAFPKENKMCDKMPMSIHCIWIHFLLFMSYRITEENPFGPLMQAVIQSFCTAFDWKVGFLH